MKLADAKSTINKQPSHQVGPTFAYISLKVYKKDEGPQGDKEQDENTRFIKIGYTNNGTLRERFKRQREVAAGCR